MVVATASVRQMIHHRFIRLEDLLRKSWNLTTAGNRLAENNLFLSAGTKIGDTIISFFCEIFTYAIVIVTLDLFTFHII